MDISLRLASLALAESAGTQGPDVPLFPRLLDLCRCHARCQHRRGFAGDPVAETALEGPHGPETALSGHSALRLCFCLPAGPIRSVPTWNRRKTIESRILSKGLLKSTLSGNQGILITGCYPDNDKSFDSFDLPIIRFRYEGDYQEEVFIWQKADLKLNTRHIEQILWSPDRSDTLWLLIVDISKTESGHHRKLNLLTLRLNPDTKKAQQTGDQFLAEYTSPDNSWPAGGRCVLAQDRLYIPAFGKLVVLDVSQPQSPVIVQTIDQWHPHGVNPAAHAVWCSGIVPFLRKASVLLSRRLSRQR